MGTCWLTIPSARPPAEVEPVLAKWKERGYKIALFCDTRDDLTAKNSREGMIGIADNYPGYARAVNRLIQGVMASYHDAEWFIAAGDDTLPDPNHTAEEIAAECSGYFRHGGNSSPVAAWDATFGVMQPTGDPWRDVQGRIIERIAGSAWLGREFCRRIYGGKGPLWPEFTHMFVDEHLQCVAQKLGIFWQRPDLVQHHAHWGRESRQVIPTHLTQWNTSEHWDSSKAIFNRLKAGGFAETNDLLP